MEKEKINKIVELTRRKDALDFLLNTINRNDVSLQLRKKDGLQLASYPTAASSYLEELHKRFVAMVMLDINDIETELETL